MKNHGIFAKVFTYTILSVVLLVAVTAALFSQQFLAFYRTIQIREISASYRPLTEQLQNSNDGEIPELARRFSERNQSFVFTIVDGDGGLLYATPTANTSGSFRGDFFLVVHRGKGFEIIAQSKTGLESFDRDLRIRASVVLGMVLVFCLVCALVFARKMTKPIQLLVGNVGRMANLEEVPPPLERKDELGKLAHDVYTMYDKLKETIARLESEILREREMEENQRYFFSAASHELKTPIAATSVLLEGMLQNIGDYKDHSKYLRECLKMMDTQSKLISEILEMVSLSDGRMVPVPEEVNIRQLVSDMLPEYQTLASAGGLKMALNIPEGQCCHADPHMLRKALSSVLLNAVQNTPQGGEVRIWSEFTPAGYRLCLYNSGAKIDSAVLPKLFDPFYRVDQARSRKTGRSGLGLAIVAKTLEAMNLTFSIENTPDGVLFWIQLPKG